METQQQAEQHRTSDTPKAAPAQKPSVGRVVHYFKGEEPMAAMICKVHSDDVVNLTVFKPEGGTAAAKSVSRLPGGPTRWDWPARV